jgi:deoxyribose-phosphate aldolase
MKQEAYHFSGGRRSPTAEKFIEIGAERIGTSSAVEIAKEVLHGREV